MVKKKNALRKRKAAGKKTGTLRRSTARRKKAPRSSKRSRQKEAVRTTRRFPLVTSLDIGATGRRGFGAHSAGQSGDTQGLSSAEEADSESVEGLVEEGQDFEAGVVAGVEEADASEGEVRTTQVREDDVPLEYLEQDLDRLNRTRPLPRSTAAKQTATSTRVSRGPVDAPGKRHRKALPQEPIDKRLGEPRGKQMGQKNDKSDRRGGRR